VAASLDWYPIPEILTRVGNKVLRCVFECRTGAEDELRLAPIPELEKSVITSSWGQDQSIERDVNPFWDFG
jgi:hypothetical protein